MSSPLSTHITKGRQYLYAVETREFPGKVQVRYVTFTEELIPLKEFERRVFEIGDPSRPEIAQFLRVMLGGTHLGPDLE